jgi:hypothetical protein
MKLDVTGKTDCLFSPDERYDAEVSMLGCPCRHSGYHSRVQPGTWVHPTLYSLQYAIRLLQRGGAENIEQARKIAGAVMALQDTDPGSPTYGIWPYFLEEPLACMSPPDWNWADFCGARLAIMLLVHSKAIGEELCKSLRTSLEHAARAIVRRDVGPSYTNIAILGAGVTLLAGEILKKPELVTYGRQRLAKLVESVKYHGSFNEYNSPHYGIITLKELERVLRYVNDAKARKHAEFLRCHLWELIAGHYHPQTGQWAGPHNRAYLDWLSHRIVQLLADRTGVELSARHTNGTADMLNPNSSQKIDSNAACPQHLIERFRRLPEPQYEHRMRFVRSSDESRSVWGTTWFSDDVCIGSVNRDCLWNQRRPLIAYWRAKEDAAVCLRARFMHDGRDFASTVMRNAQAGVRVLSTVGLATNMGDFHVSLDKPEKPVFSAEDFRIRYQLAGNGIGGKQIGENVFMLKAEPYKAIVHALPARFGPHEVKWQLAEEHDAVAVEGICYSGRRCEFDLSSFRPVAIAVGLELLPSDKPPSPSPVRVDSRDERALAVSWPGEGKELSIEAPLWPEEL